MSKKKHRPQSLLAPKKAARPTPPIADPRTIEPPPAQAAGGSAAPTLGSTLLEAAKSVITRKLDLACGQNCKPGFEGVDYVQADGVKHVVDLQKYPWPFEDNSVLEVHCSHYVEHIPMYPLVDGQDPLFRFFDELHRILVPEGWAEIIVPSARSNRAFQDPTHRRFIVAETFLYLSAEWRKLQKLDHYNVKCNFGCDVNPTIPVELSLLHPEAANRRMNHEWNTTVDWVAKLKKLPWPPPTANQQS